MLKSEVGNFGTNNILNSKFPAKFTTIPLLCSYLKEDKKILLQSDIALLLDLFSKLDKKAFQLKNNYLPRFCAQAERPVSFFPNLNFH